MNIRRQLRDNEQNLDFGIAFSATVIDIHVNIVSLRFEEVHPCAVLSQLRIKASKVPRLMFGFKEPSDWHVEEADPLLAGSESL